MTRTVPWWLPQLAGWLTILTAFSLVDGVPGVLLAGVGIVQLWHGWRLATRDDRGDAR
jgi:hypothetical protein